MVSALALVKSSTGGSTTRMGHLLGTTSTVMESPGQTSPSSEVARQVRKMMRQRGIWSIDM